MRSTLTTTLTLLGILGLGGTALAQSTGAPAGVDAATAPGGTEGAAGRRNVNEAIRSGDTVPVAPGGTVTAPPPGAVPIEPAAPPVTVRP